MTALNEKAAMEARVRKAETRIKELEDRVQALNKAVAGLILEREADGSR